MASGTDLIDTVLTNQRGADYSGVMVARKSTGKRGGRREGAGRKPMFSDRARITIDMERADLDALGAISEKREVSVAQVIRDAIAALLRRQRK